MGEKTEKLKKLLEKEFINDLEQYRSVLEKRHGLCPKESEVQKHVESFLHNIFCDTQIGIVDVSRNNSITAKHNPSPYSLLSAEECAKKPNKNSALNIFKNEFRNDAMKVRDKALNKYNDCFSRTHEDLSHNEISTLKGGAPDILIASGFEYNNVIKNDIGYELCGNAVYHASVEVKDLNVDIDDLCNNIMDFSQIYSHLIKVPVVILTNGRQWRIYRNGSNGPELVLKVTLWKEEQLYPESWDALNGKLNELKNIFTDSKRAEGNGHD